MPGPFDDLRIGEPDKRGQKITFIIGRSTDLIVYMVEGDHLKFDTATDVPTSRELQILREYDRIHSYISIAIQKDKAQPLKVDLGSALFRAFSDKTGTCPPLNYFVDVAEHIETRALDIARFIYVASGFSFAFAASIVCVIAYISPWLSDTLKTMVIG